MLSVLKVLVQLDIFSPENFIMSLVCLLALFLLRGEEQELRLGQAEISLVRLLQLNCH